MLGDQVRQLTDNPPLNLLRGDKEKVWLFSSNVKVHLIHDEGEGPGSGRVPVCRATEGTVHIYKKSREKCHANGREFVHKMKLCIYNGAASGKHQQEELKWKLTYDTSCVQTGSDKTYFVLPVPNLTTLNMELALTVDTELLNNNNSPEKDEQNLGLLLAALCDFSHVSNYLRFRTPSNRSLEVTDDFFDKFYMDRVGDASQNGLPGYEGRNSTSEKPGILSERIDSLQTLEFNSAMLESYSLNLQQQQPIIASAKQGCGQHGNQDTRRPKTEGNSNSNRPQLVINSSRQGMSTVAARNRPTCVPPLPQPRHSKRFQRAQSAYHKRSKDDAIYDVIESQSAPLVSMQRYFDENHKICYVKPEIGIHDPYDTRGQEVLYM